MATESAAESQVDAEQIRLALDDALDHLALQITNKTPAAYPAGALDVGRRIAEAFAADGLDVDDTHERGPVEYHEALGRIAMASIDHSTKGRRAPNSAEAVDADPMAYRCPSCGAIKPPMGVAYTQAEVPGMGELIYATIFCGKCRVILTTQILEMHSAALAAQKSGFAPPNPSRLWTPGGRGN